jgi:uncharacterized Fe-S cluster-containing MiaB family protein
MTNVDKTIIKKGVCDPYCKMLEENCPLRTQDDIKLFSTELKSILSLLRKDPKKQDDGSEHYRIVKSQSNIDRFRAIIGIPTKGCSYAQNSFGGCAICGHISSPLWNKKIKSSMVLSDFQKSFDAVKEASPESISLFHQVPF